MVVIPSKPPPNFAQVGSPANIKVDRAVTHATSAAGAANLVDVVEPVGIFVHDTLAVRSNLVGRGLCPDASCE